MKQNSGQEKMSNSRFIKFMNGGKEMEQNSSEEMMQEAIIKLAAEKYVESEGKKILEEARALNAEEGGGPSEEQRAAFEKLLDRELKKQRRKSAGKKRLAYKVAAVATVVLVAVNVTIASVPAVRLAVLRMLTKQYQEYSRIASDPSGKAETDTSNGRYKITFDKEYKVTYLPEGFEIAGYKKKADGIEITYRDEQNRVIGFWQNVNQAASYVDTEDSDVEYVDINGIQAIISERDPYIAITLKMGNCFITLNGKGVSEEELIQVAKSIEEVKK